MSGLHMVKPTPAVGNRAYMPPIETVIPAGESLTDYRHDNPMMNAFGLNDDLQHWLRMKAHGLYVCQEELPPTRLPRSVKKTWKRNRLDEEQIGKLTYNSATDIAKRYLWEFALTSWRNAFDYDVQYLQRRYPDCNARAVICGMFARWNAAPDFKWLTRKHAKGRDLYQLYYQLSTEANSSEIVTNGTSPAQQEAQVSTPSRSTQLAEVDSTEDVVPISSLTADHRAPSKNQNKTAERSGDMQWAHIILDIQHVDHSKAKLNRLAFIFICGLNPCSPRNIQIDVIKEKLRTQNVNADDFDLQLRGVQDKFSWDVSDMCVALTLWCRDRSDNDFDVPLLLVPRAPQLSTIAMTRQDEVRPSRTNQQTTAVNTVNGNGITREQNNETPRKEGNEPGRKTLRRGCKRTRPIVDLTVEVSSDEEVRPRSARRVQQELSQVRRELTQLRAP